MNQSSQNSWLWNRDPLSLRNASIEAESLCKSVTVPILFSSTTPRFLLWNASATNTSKIFRYAGETWWNIDLKSHLKPSFPIVSYSNLIYIQLSIYIYIFISIYGSFKIQHLILPPVSKSLLYEKVDVVFLFKGSPWFNLLWKPQGVFFLESPGEPFDNLDLSRSGATGLQLRSLLQIGSFFAL